MATRVIALLLLDVYGDLLRHNLTEAQALAAIAAPVIIAAALSWSRRCLVAR